MPTEGLIAAPHTPFDSQGRLNRDVIALQAEHLVRSGVVGVFVGGSTGEGLSLTTDERMALVETWRKVAPAESLKLIAHVGHNSQADAVALASQAAGVGVDAIAAFAPSYYRPQTVSELVGFFEPIAAAATGCDFYYYDIPSMTAVGLSVIELLKAAEGRIPTLRGVKATNMDLMQLQECLAFNDGGIDVLFGFDENLLAGLALGARGAVGSTYNLVAPLYLRVIEAFDRGDWQTAREHQLQAVRIVRCLQKFGFMRAAKQAMAFVGVDCGACRAPFLPMSTQERDSLKRELEEVGFFQWQPAGN